MSHDLVAIVAAILLVVGLPLLTARGGLTEEQLEDVRDARASVYLSAAISLVFIAGLFYLIAVWRKIPSEVVGWQVGPAGPAFAWAAATAVAGLAVVWLVVRIGLRAGLPECRSLRTGRRGLHGVGGVAADGRQGRPAGPRY